MPHKHVKNSTSLITKERGSIKRVYKIIRFTVLLSLWVPNASIIPFSLSVSNSSLLSLSLAPLPRLWHWLQWRKWFAYSLTAASYIRQIEGLQELCVKWRKNTRRGCKRKRCKKNEKKVAVSLKMILEKKVATLQTRLKMMLEKKVCVHRCKNTRGGCKNTWRGCNNCLKFISKKKVVAFLTRLKM